MDSLLPEDLRLVGYKSHEAMKVEMIAPIKI